MKSLRSLDACFCAMILVVALTGFSHAELEDTKNRRANGPSGLVAFPRVGRRDPNINNNNNLHEVESFDDFESLYGNSLDDYTEFPKGEIKRSSLIAFPRVGRTDVELRKWARLMALQQALDKRAGPSATSGLWFGPRLGKRSVDNSQYAAAIKAPKPLY